MGVHHFEMKALPRSFDPKNHPDDGFLISHPLSPLILTRLRQLLPRENSWGNTEEFISESEWGSDLRIWKNENGAVQDVVFRFAPIGGGLSFLRIFLNIVKDANCCIYLTKSQCVSEPDMESVLALFKQSDACRFINDPELALIEAAERIRQQED